MRTTLIGVSNRLERVHKMERVRTKEWRKTRSLGQDVQPSRVTDLNLIEVHI